MNAFALRKLRGAVEKSGAVAGYSNSRTCEIGLTTNSGIQYQSLVYLVDRCTRGKHWSDIYRKVKKRRFTALFLVYFQPVGTF